MPRAKNTATFTARRGEILDVFQRLIYTKGYENIAIQDILTELDMSKGAFYHYFVSKRAMLEALIIRLLDETAPLVASVAESRQPAIDRLNAFF